MKKLLTIILILYSFAASAQLFPPGYTGINSRYDWLAGKFRNGLTIPAGATPALFPGQFTGAGALFVDSVQNKFYFYSSGVWREATGGFFGDETNNSGSTTKDADGYNFTLSGVDTLTLGFNELYLPNVPDGDEEEEGLKFLFRNSEGRVVTGNIGSLRFGQGDNIAESGRFFDLNGFDIVIADASADPAEGVPYYAFYPHQVDFAIQSDGYNSRFSLEPQGSSLIFSTEGSSFAGLVVDGINPDFADVDIYASGQITLNSDSVQYAEITTVSDTSLYKPLVIDEEGYVKRFDHWPGSGGSGDNIYTANGTLSGNRTLAGGNNSLTINGLSSFSARATGASVSQIFFDGSGTAIWEPFGTAYVALSDQQIDIDALNVFFPQLTGSGDRYAGFNSLGKLIEMPAPGSGSFDGILELGDSPFGLTKPNDSTYALDTADADLQEWITGLVTPNLVVQPSLGTGKNIFSHSGDTLYMHRMDEGYGINITKSSDSTNIIAVDTTQIATKSLLELTRDSLRAEMEAIEPGGGFKRQHPLCIITFRSHDE